MNTFDLKPFAIPTGKTVHISNYPTHAHLNEKYDNQIGKKLEENIEKLRAYQQILMAEEKQAIIFVLQALDAAGKDEAERYFFSNLSSQALKTTSFDKPSEEEKKHDYLWRLHDALPERGMIGVFNRSHYENVVAERIHNELENYPLPEEMKNDNQIWEKRFKHIRNYEDYLADNGFHMIKIYLNVSKDIQKERLLERLEDPERNWEFSLSDLEDRQLWEDYMAVFEETFEKTSSDKSPWYIIPADHEEEAHYLISEIFLEKLAELNPEYPTLSAEEEEEFNQAIKDLKAGKYD